MILTFRYCLSIFLFIICLSFSYGQDRSKINNAQKSNYDILKIGEIPLGLWVTPPSVYQNVLEYKKIRECGLNFINGFSRNESDLQKISRVLDLCYENKLKYFVSKYSVHHDIISFSKDADSSLLNKFIDNIKPYSNHPAYVGELLMDEPGKPLFNSVAAFTESFRNAFGNKIPHVNLFPSYATGGIQCSSYDEYIDEWIHTQAPKLISFDSYPLLTDGDIIKDYYYNLDLIRSKTRKLKIPFWTFVQTLSISGTSGVPDKREPSEADIRWQVWSNLVFGSKGIQYFCYWTPGSGIEQFGDALIDLNGKETVRYGYVKKLNSDIRSVGKVLLNCDAEGVIQVGDVEFEMFEPLKTFGDIVSVTGQNSIIGCFSSSTNKKKILITTATPNKNGNVKINLSPQVKSLRIWKNNKVNRIKVRGNSIFFQLEAGDAIFIEFD